MQWGQVVAVGTSRFKSCKPKIDGIDKMINLYADIDASCSIKVINAQVYPSEVVTTNTSSNSTSTDSSSTSSVPWWAIMIMVFVGIAVIIVVGGFVQVVL
uniref:Uncharacterized protein n=1 Tax=Panagrolaimus superbus TaxID=310955 RepID=A0A914Z220_9BILA